MRNVNVKNLALITGIIFLISACEKSDELVVQSDSMVENAELKSAGTLEDNKELKSARNTRGFVQGITVEIDGEDYYFMGPPVYQNDSEGARDVPGHYWVQSGPDKVMGKHYNTGPFGAPEWWSSDAGDGELLYMVKGIIDIWTEEKAKQYASRGFVHYHEFVNAEDGSIHPSKVVWLKHTARTFFTLDGGPGEPNPHEVTPGIDYEFMPNWDVPYDPDAGHDH